MDQEYKDKAIQQYINWAVEQQDFKDKLKRVVEIYTNYYTEAEDGVGMALEHFKVEEAERRIPTPPARLAAIRTRIDEIRKGG